MRRYWVSDRPKGKDFIIKGEKFHHIFKVCRHLLSSRFEILNPGISYLVQVEKIHKQEAVCKVISSRTIPKLKQPFLHLFVSISKFATFEFILEKSVELGVKSITPMFSKFSSVKDPKKILAKTDRWNKIVQSATEQCARGELLIINKPKNLEQIDKDGFFADIQSKGFDALDKEKPVNNINLFVGSEGGFSDGERKYFKSKGLKGIGLGDNILKVETACISLISICKYKLNLI